MSPRLELFGASVMCVLLGVFQIKRRDTDIFLEFCGCTEIACGIILILVTIFGWNYIV